MIFNITPFPKCFTTMRALKAFCEPVGSFKLPCCEIVRSFNAMFHQRLLSLNLSFSFLFHFICVFDIIINIFRSQSTLFLCSDINRRYWILFPLLLSKTNAWLHLWRSVLVYSVRNHRHWRNRNQLWYFIPHLRSWHHVHILRLLYWRLIHDKRLHRNYVPITIIWWIRLLIHWHLWLLLERSSDIWVVHHLLFSEFNFYILWSKCI